MIPKLSAAWVCPWSQTPNVTPVRRPSKNTPASIRPTYMRPATVLVCVCVVCVCMYFEHCKMVTGYVGMTTSFIFHMYRMFIFICTECSFFICTECSFFVCTFFICAFFVCTFFVCIDRISLSLAITSDLGIAIQRGRNITRRMQFSLSFGEHANNHIRLLRLLYRTCMLWPSAN